MSDLNIMDKILADVASKRFQILEDFTKAYVAETGLHPSECEMVEWRKSQTEIVWFFRKKTIERMDFEI